MDTEVRALPYVLVLHAFCVVDPMLCAPASNPSQFVVTLQPYLKSQVICYSFRILYFFSQLDILLVLVKIAINNLITNSNISQMVVRTIKVVLFFKIIKVKSSD